MAVHVFCMYARKKSFVEFDRFLACGMAHFVAAKVSEKRPTVEFYTKYVHENRPQTKVVKGKTNKQKPFSDVKEALTAEVMSLELDLLSVLGFEFDFDLPLQYLPTADQRQYCVDNVYRNSPQRAYYLFYPS